MAKTYAEFLKENGATDDEIKILDVPSARKAYDAQVKLAADAASAAAKAKADADAYQKWYEEQGLPYATRMEQERDVARAEAAAEKARLKTLQDAGLIKVAAEDDAAKAAAAAAAANGGKLPADFDPKKYVPVEQFQELAVRAADSISLMADLQQEHQALGLPPVSWRALKSEAAAARQDVETFWRTKFNVDAKRAEKAAADRAAYEKKIADDAVAKFRVENPASNPLLGIAVPSRTPFTAKPPSASDAAMPWNKSDTERVNDRIARLQQKHPDLLN